MSAATLGTVSSSYGYNGFGELTSLDATFQGSVNFRQTLERDALGRIVELDELIGSTQSTTLYTYDAAGRLETATRDGSVTTYQYDDNGNRTAVLVNGREIAAAEYDAQDRLLTHGDLIFEQTEHGDLLRRSGPDGALELSYDGLGNLLTANVTSAVATKSVDYTIDGFGRRVGKQVGGSFSRAWLYRDELRPVAEISDAGVFSHFVYAAEAQGAPDFMLRGGVPFRFVKDHLGSVRLVVNATTGVVAQRLDYDEFGNVTQDSAPGFQPFGFAGGLYDADTGLVRFGARDYDASIGRWVAKDPIGFEGGDTNLYAYVGSDPVNLTDPMGLDPSTKECVDLMKKIKNVEHEIQKRVGELAEEVLGLPESAPGDDLHPSRSKRGHRKLLNMHKANLAALKARYLAKCGPPPGGPTSRGRSFFEWEYWEEVTGLTGAALVAYLIISEGSRIFPPRNLVPIP